MKIESKIMEHVKDVLLKFDNLYIENNQLKRNKVIQDLDSYNSELITALLSDDLIKKTYTEKILDTEIFKINQFIEMFEYKEFWEDSYTKYQNKIGLTTNGKFIDDSSDVVLDFPFKDAVLKAGMSKEDLEKNENIDEVFLNEVIAKSEIDELLESKILINAKKYDETGVHDIDEFNMDENLIVKGNNLIALHSIKKRYAGKIKLIYLDPPYNTGSDSFVYNDRFNHSAWLTFMKNRLEIAQDFLSNDGVIFLHIDSRELFHLKVLCDSIFGEDNFISLITLKVKAPSGVASGANMFFDSSEYLLVYSKNRQLLSYNTIKNDAEIVKAGSKTAKNYKYRLENINYNNKKLIYKNDDMNIYEINNADFNYSSMETYSEEEYATYYDNIFRLASLSGGTEKKVLNIIKNRENNFNNLYIYEYIPSQGKNKGKKISNLIIKNSAVLMLKDFSIKKEKQVIKQEHITNIFNNDWWQGISNEGQVKFKNAKKPEKLIQTLISIATNENDIVLDFFMGSGTTQAVAMKMNRKFIGIEQMDYINTISIPRLQKVIDGEQSGISKEVNWTGGGSFIYVELMEKNKGFIQELQKASNMTELNSLFERMKLGADFDFRVDLEKFETDRNKNHLSFEQQKDLLFKMIDKNQLYYNESNIDDEDIKSLISDTDYKFNKSFYGE